MLKALPPLTPVWYTPLAERESEQPTQFYLRPLSGPELADVEVYKDRSGNFQFTGPSVRALLRYSLRDWKNFGDGAAEVRFNKVNADENLQRLDAATTRELADQVWYMSVLTEEDRKKLELPSTSQKTQSNSTVSVADSDGTVTSETQHRSRSGASRG